MKELTIEQKAKLYDEALERARLELQEKGNEPDGASILSKLFPELKESEDERIRKEMIFWLKGFIGEEELCGYTEDEIRERIAWLEKQGEQKPTVIIPKFRIGDTIHKKGESTMYLMKIERITDGGSYVCNNERDFVNIECQDNFELVEQKPVEPTLDIEIPFGAKDSELIGESITIPDGCYAIIDGNKVVIRKGEKPAEWTAEDENQRINTIGLVKNANDCAGILDKETALNWLNDIKDRFVPQPKQEWSKEDETIAKALTKAANDNVLYGYIGKSKLSEYLKSLKDRYTWRPSEEQMVALDGICSYIRNKADWEISQDMVSDLYKLSEQLKKLKG